MSELRSIPLSTAEQQDSKPADSFDDLAALRLGQDFRSSGRVPLKVPVRKPMAQAFVRVRPGSEWRIDTAILEDKSELERDRYLVSAAMREELSSECYAATLFTTITRQGSLFLWPVRLPDVGGRDNDFWPGCG